MPKPLPEDHTVTLEEWRAQQQRQSKPRKPNNGTPPRRKAEGGGPRPLEGVVHSQGRTPRDEVDLRRDEAQLERAVRPVEDALAVLYPDPYDGLDGENPQNPEHWVMCRGCRALADKDRLTDGFCEECLGAIAFIVAMQRGRTWCRVGHWMDRRGHPATRVNAAGVCPACDPDGGVEKCRYCEREPVRPGLQPACQVCAGWLMSHAEEYEDAHALAAALQVAITKRHQQQSRQNRWQATTCVNPACSKHELFSLGACRACYAYTSKHPVGVYLFGLYGELRCLHRPEALILKEVRRAGRHPKK